MEALRAELLCMAVLIGGGDAEELGAVAFGFGAGLTNAGDGLFGQLGDILVGEVGFLTHADDEFGPLKVVLMQRTNERDDVGAPQICGAGRRWPERGGRWRVTEPARVCGGARWRGWLFRFCFHICR